MAAALAGAAAANAADRPSGARFVWYDKDGEGRNTFALFRKSFTVPGVVEGAELHLFADTSYQLFVNGQFVEFGPVRCDPRFPLFDTHEIGPLLRPGRNVIAVEVNFWGLKTFKAMPVRGAMIAWGAVKYGGGAVDLTTRAGQWRVTKSRSRARYAPALSFALPAADLFEQTAGEDGWKKLDFDESAWTPSVEIAKQDSWGELQPRSIPFMSAGAVDIAKPAIAMPLQRNEDWHSFSVPVPHHFADDANQFSNFVAFSTWVFSPREQTIPVGVFHGRHWLNGTAVAKGTDSIDRPMRVTERWKLNQGWNYFFGSVDAYFDVLDEYFAFPPNAGLVVSTDKSPDSPYSFRHSPVLKADDCTRFLKPKPLPYAADERLDDVGGWTYVTPRRVPAARRVGTNMATPGNRFHRGCPAVTPFAWRITRTVSPSSSTWSGCTWRCRSSILAVCGGPPWTSPIPSGSRPIASTSSNSAGIRWATACCARKTRFRGCPPVRAARAIAWSPSEIRGRT